VKAAAIALTVIVALALQTSLAWFLTPGANVVDLVFVAVVYIGLAAGPAAGLIAGAVAGLAQDALAATGTSTIAVLSGVVTARSIIGIGGLAKTVVGFFAGIVGSQFIVARPIPRALVFFTATVGHAIIFVGLYRMIDQGTEPSTSAIFGQAGANSLVGMVLFQISESLPGFVDRRRSMGGMHINRRF
jgi:cell shape-determining protein MreD